MRDRFNVSGQAAGVKRNAHAHDMTLSQIWNATLEEINLNKLAPELGTLRDAMRRAATSAEDAVATAEVANAEAAAARGDGVAVMQHLKRADESALSCAERIGTGLAVAALKKAMGI